MFQTINLQNNRQLSMVRNGWFNGDFELTDGNAVYGRLYYEWINRRTAYAEAANWRWTFRSPFMRRGLDILDENGVVIGQAWRDLFSMTVNLKMNNGFEAEYYRPAILSREWIWESPANGTILRARGYPFSLRDDFEIVATTAPVELITLLTLLTTHINILRRRRRAAL